MALCLSLLHIFIQQNLNSSSEQVRILLVACDLFGVMRTSGFYLVHHSQKTIINSSIYIFLEKANLALYFPAPYIDICNSEIYVPNGTYVICIIVDYCFHKISVILFKENKETHYEFSCCCSSTFPQHYNVKVTLMTYFKHYQI